MHHLYSRGSGRARRVIATPAREPTCRCEAIQKACLQRRPWPYGRLARAFPCGAFDKATGRQEACRSHRGERLPYSPRTRRTGDEQSCPT